MKRTIVILAGLATLGAAVAFDVQTWAQAPVQQPVAQPRSLQTRIGLINMVEVLKNYKKFQSLEAQIRGRAEELEKTFAPMKGEMDKLKAAYNDPKNSQEEKEKIEHRVRQLASEMQMKEEDAKKELIKKNGDAAVMIYREVEDAATAYARGNNYELVLFYNDAITKDDFYHPNNVQRKLTQPNTLMPLVVAPGMDISDQVMNMLNLKYQGSAALPPANPGAPHN